MGNAATQSINSVSDALAEAFKRTVSPALADLSGIVAAHSVGVDGRLRASLAIFFLAFNGHACRHSWRGIDDDLVRQHSFDILDFDLVPILHFSSLLRID